MYDVEVDGPKREDPLQPDVDGMPCRGDDRRRDRRRRARRPGRRRGRGRAHVRPAVDARPHVRRREVHLSSASASASGLVARRPASDVPAASGIAPVRSSRARCTSAIETVGLSKTLRRSVRALVDLDLQVERGEVFGYLGPERRREEDDDPAPARPDPSDVRPRIALRARHPTRRRRVASARRLPARRPAPRGSPDGPRAARLARAPARRASTTRLRDELCERLDVVLDRPIRQLSKGNRQKVGLVQAFMHRPDLVVLDEPTAGLDPLLQGEVRSLLRETAADGRTVFLSSHSLDEVQHVADRVGIIRSGRLVDVDAVETPAGALAPARDGHVRRAGRPVAVRVSRGRARSSSIDGTRRAALGARDGDGRAREGASRATRSSTSSRSRRISRRSSSSCTGRPTTAAELVPTRAARPPARARRLVRRHRRLRRAHRGDLPVDRELARARTSSSRATRTS